MKKFIVVISDDQKHAVADSRAAEWYQDLLLHQSDSSTIANVATSIQFNELRVGVASGEIEPFEFGYKGKNIQCTATGSLSEWPEGLFDHLGKQVKTLMSAPRKTSSLASQSK